MKWYLIDFLGVKVHPDSVQLWEAYLKSMIETFRSEHDIKYVFEKAVNSLKEKAKSLWMMYIKYIIQKYDGDYIEGLYKRAIQQHGDIRPHYLQWLYRAKGIQEVRKQYDVLAPKMPFVKELHKVMLKLETIQFKSNVKRWELVHEYATQQFPSDRHIRYNYLQFLKHTKNCSKNELIMEYEKALNDLIETDKPLFQTECRDFMLEPILAFDVL